MLALLFHVLLSSTLASASAFSFQAQDLITHREITFPSPKAKVTVVAFLSAKCPCSGSHEASLNQLAKTYQAKGYAFVGVHANQDEPVAMAAEHFKKSALSFPVVQDTGAKIADELKALKTPHVFVFENDQIVFAGGVDNSADASRAKKFYLKNALAEIDAGKPVTVAHARALGCFIKR